MLPLPGMLIFCHIQADWYEICIYKVGWIFHLCYSPCRRMCPILLNYRTAEANQPGVCGFLNRVITSSVKRYSNVRGNSPIAGYEFEPTRITVWFKNGKPYSYSYASAGANKVETMKELACRGKGLSAFIARHVRFNYE